MNTPDKLDTIQAVNRIYWRRHMRDERVEGKKKVWLNDAKTSDTRSDHVRRHAVPYSPPACKHFPANSWNTSHAFKTNSTPSKSKVLP